jgi:hypothetical protein
MFTETLTCPPIVPGGVATGAFKLPAIVTDAICRTAGVTSVGGWITTVAQFSTLAAPVAVAVAQIATPGDAVTPRTVVLVLLDADSVAAELLDDHATVAVTPASTLTAAVSVTVWPALIVAELGATSTLSILPAVLLGPTTLTLSPQAAAITAVAAMSDRRRTLMYYPPEVKKRLYNPAKYADDRTDRQP